MGYNGDIENIPLDGYMFCGKEEHNHCGKHMDGYFEMGYQDGKKIWNGNSGHAPVGVMRL